MYNLKSLVGPIPKVSTSNFHLLVFSYFSHAPFQTTTSFQPYHNESCAWAMIVPQK